MLAPIAVAISPTSSGSNAAPQASGVGKAVAHQVANPVRHSSCAMAGIPNDEVAMMTHRNAAKLFRHPLPEKCLPCHQRQYDELRSAVKAGYRSVSPLMNEPI